MGLPTSLTPPMDPLVLVPREGVFGPNGEPVLRFNDTNLQNAIDRALADTDKAKMSAFFEFEDPNGPATLETRLGVAVKLGGAESKWSIGGVLAHRGGTHGGLSGGVKLRKAF